jgi:hypothetical protein
MIVAMPRDGAIIFGDPIGKLDVLSVACEAGRYQLQRLIDDRGRDAKLIDWLDEITADCPCAQHKRSMRRTMPGFAEGVVTAKRRSTASVAQGRIHSYQGGSGPADDLR